jgi:hypothetical protein
MGPDEATTPPEPPSGSGRALILGLLIVAAFSVAGSFSVLLRYEIIGTGYLPRGAVTVLLILVLITWLLRSLARRRALRRKETLLVFGMLMAMAAVPGQEFSQHVYLNQIGIVYYATPDIARPQLYLHDLNPYLVPSKDRDDPIIRYAFEGVPPGAGVPYGRWLMPLAVWTPFWFALYWVILCFAGLMARRWEDHEKVLFPLTAVPNELIAQDRQAVAPALRNRMLWVCLAVSAGIYVLKGLHTYFPGVPDINMQRVGGVLFGEGPARVFNNLPLHIYPEMIGITYLLSAEVGFSLWFSYWLRLLQTFLREGVGLNANHYGFFAYQTVGGYAVLGAALLWSARRYLAEAFRRGFAAACGRGRADDPVHAVAAPGFVLGMAFIVWWCAKVGVSLTWAVVTYLSFVAVCLVVARVICEAGMFIYSSPFRLNEVIFDLVGVKRLGAQNVTLLTMASWAQIRSTATMNMTAVFQGFKLGSLGGIDRRRMFWAMYAAVVVAILCAHVVSVYTVYTWSVPKLGWWPSGSSLGATNTLAKRLQTPPEMSLDEWVGLGIGGATTLLLVAMRQRFLWWPWHPLGFVAWLGWPIDRYWLSILVGWLWKVTVVRVAGFKWFSSFRPAAFGLILGICLILTVWLVVHMIVPGPPVLIE